MNWRVQFIREIKFLLVWGLVPFIGLISIFKVAWDWYITGVFNGGNAFQLLASAVAVVVCGYLSRKEYLRWQTNALAGTTEFGEIVRVISTDGSTGNVLALISAVVLLAVLAIFRPIAIAPILILWCTGAVWWPFLSTFMASNQCLIGTHGLWTAFAGWRISVPYSSIDGVNRRRTTDSSQVWISLLVKEAFQGRVDLFTPLDQAAVDILKGHIRAESPTSVKA